MRGGRLKKVLYLDKKKPKQIPIDKLCGWISWTDTTGQFFSLLANESADQNERAPEQAPFQDQAWAMSIFVDFYTELGNENLFLLGSKPY